MSRDLIVVWSAPITGRMKFLIQRFSQTRRARAQHPPQTICNDLATSTLRLFGSRVWTRTADWLSEGQVSRLVGEHFFGAFVSDAVTDASPSPPTYHHPR